MVVGGALLLSATGFAPVAESREAPPKSKLGIHLIGPYTAGAKLIVAANLPILKLLDLHDDMRAALKDYKTRHPQGIVVVRIYTPARYQISDDPTTKGKEFWEKVILPQVSRLTPQEKRWVDYLEGPNEHDTFPAWDSTETAKWFSAFWIAVATEMSKAGFKPCLGSIPVGNPPGTPEEVAAKLGAFVRALRLAKRLGGAWSYHSYTLHYTTDLNDESWYSLRYRRFYDLFRRRYPDLVDLPLLLTEGGVDNDGTQPIPGWHGRGNAEKFEQWLTWFDGQLKQNPYVKGCTLFEIGDPKSWSSFDLEPIAGWMATYLGR